MAPLPHYLRHDITADHNRLSESSTTLAANSSPIIQSLSSPPHSSGSSVFPISSSSIRSPLSSFQHRRRSHVNNHNRPSFLSNTTNSLPVSITLLPNPLSRLLSATSPTFPGFDPDLINFSNSFRSTGGPPITPPGQIVSWARLLSATSPTFPGFDPDLINFSNSFRSTGGPPITPPGQIVSWASTFNHALRDATNRSIMNIPNQIGIPLPAPVSDQHHNRQHVFTSQSSLLHHISQFTSTQNTNNSIPTSGGFTRSPPPPHTHTLATLSTLSPAQLHPQFCTKPVCTLKCRHCTRSISNRAMKAVLLADSSVELYSTDLPLKGAVSLINDPYVTDNCKCEIRDIACLGCGNCIGYHVTHPCASCLTSCNNGQRTMFTDAIAFDRQHPQTGASLIWGQLPSVHSLKQSTGSRSLRNVFRHSPNNTLMDDWVLISTHQSNPKSPLDAVIDDEKSEMGIMGGWSIGGVSCDVNYSHSEHLVGHR